MIPYGQHWIDDEDKRAVIEALESGYLTQGPAVEEFERAVAAYCGARYAVAVSSGTAALHIACAAAGLKAGDEAVTSPITFVASANGAAYCGADVAFADIERQTFNMDPEALKKRIGKKTRAVIPVHFGGLPCDMEAINELASTRGIAIIEDACHAFGAEWRDSDGKWRKVGACSHSDLTVFSFHPVKHITTCEGGAVVTNSQSYYERLLTLRCHGITKSEKEFVNKGLAFSDGTPNPWYYEMKELGFNYRLSTLQCALGLAQLERADAFLTLRRNIAKRYDDAFENCTAIEIRKTPPDKKSSNHLYVIEIDFKKARIDRSSAMAELKRRGIGSQVHYIPVHLQPYYRERSGYRPGDFPRSEEYYSRALSLPIYPKMTPSDVDNVITSVKGIFV